MEGLEDDIAVLEEQVEVSDNWETITYIGFSRTQGDIELTGKPVRIRYINRREEKSKRIKEIHHVLLEGSGKLKKVNEVINMVNALMDKEEEINNLKDNLLKLIESCEGE